MKEHDTHIEHINENGGSLYSYISNRSIIVHSLSFLLKVHKNGHFLGSDFEICAFS